MRAGLPDTPVGRQVDWFLGAIATNEQDEAVVASRFTQRFLAAVPLAALTGSFEHLAWTTDASIEVHSESATELTILLSVEGEVRLVLTAAVEDDEPHLIAGLTVRPPSPSVLQILDAPPASRAALADVVAESFGPLAEKLPAGGVVVGVSSKGAREIFSFGADPDLHYEIGSVTKTFTALLLAEMSGRGEVHLDDPLQKYVPPGVKVPREPNREIALEDLATQVSGLPRLPPTLLDGDRDDDDPYAHFDEARMYADLETSELTAPIGSENLYSNFGFGLLGAALGRAAGRRFADLVFERICAPLGMTKTSFDPDVAHGAQGHSDGRPVPRWTGEMFQGAGIALESTLADMLTYAEANADPASTPIAAALEEAHRPRSPAGERMDQALGWLRIRRLDGSDVLFHNGGTSGFRSCVVVHQATKTSVVAMCNGGGDVSLDAATFGVLAALLAGDG